MTPWWEHVGRALRVCWGQAGWESAAGGDPMGPVVADIALSRSAAGFSFPIAQLPCVGLRFGSVSNRAAKRCRCLRGVTLSLLAGAAHSSHPARSSPGTRTQRASGRSTTKSFPKKKAGTTLRYRLHRGHLVPPGCTVPGWYPTDPSRRRDAHTSRAPSSRPHPSIPSPPK